MNIIFLAISLALLWLHLASVTVTLGRWMPFPLARSAGILGITLLMCLIEHGVGLGSLGWAWPITTLIAAGLLYRQKATVMTREFIAAERVLLLAMAFGLTWKWLFPTIYPTNERYTDLYFMLNYFPGDKLPPLDIWFPPLKFNFYYAFQHYGAALMGRLFNWDPGITYNIAYSLVMALSITLVWFFIGQFVSKTWSKWLLLLALASGGNGISAIYPFLNDGGNDSPAQAAGNELFANSRFIGFFDQQVNTELGHNLFPLLTAAEKPTPDFQPRVVAMENFGHQFNLADYHPPIGGFFLLFLGLAALAWAEATPADGSAPSRRQTALGQAIFTLSVPVVLITNTWVFPLAGLLWASWVGWRLQSRRPPDWAAVLAGGIGGLLMIYPFLTGFAAEALVTPIRLVEPNDHTPPWRFIGYFWPLLAVLVLSLFERKARPLALVFVVAFGLTTLAGELVFVDDHYADTLRRYNTTAKWYGWIWSGGLLACGAVALSSSKKWIQAVTAISLLACATMLVPVARYMWHWDKSDKGVFNGHPAEMRDRPVAQMLKYLRQSPRGIVVESAPAPAYTSQTMVAMFSGQIAMQGWPSLIGNWRFQPPGMWDTFSETNAFYRGELPDADTWLHRNHVSYVAWVGRDNAFPDAWDKINEAISGDYIWKPFENNPNGRVGLWIRSTP